MLFQSKGRSALLGALVLTVATTAQAQELAGNFDQLRVLIKRGDVIHVQDTSGQDVGGRLLDLSPDVLRVLVNGVPREFSASDIDVITAARHGNVAKGAKIGLATGAAFGALMTGAMMSNCSSECIPYIAIGTLYLGGIGAGIGAGLSAMTTTQRVIFARTNAAHARLTIAPLVDRTHTGALLSVRW